MTFLRVENLHIISVGFFSFSKLIAAFMVESPYHQKLWFKMLDNYFNFNKLVRNSEWFHGHDQRFLEEAKKL